MNTGNLILMLSPIIIIQLGLMLYALFDVIKRKKFRYGNKLIWIAVVVCISIIGPVLYLVLRGDEE